MTICKICNNEEDNKSYVAREMMFGYRDQFEYIECSNCGCLQIREIPHDLSKYYPEKYYSYHNPDAWLFSKDNFLKSPLKRLRTKYCLYGKNIIGMLALKISRVNFDFDWDWFKKSKIDLDSKILDVGCGAGHLLLSLQKEGFSHLVGVDPFIDDDIFLQNIRIFKKDLTEIKQKFDFIILNHSFEHMSQPLSVFNELYNMLESNRYALIRIPIASTFAWREYGINWVQLDAPRPLFLHTVKSIQILSGQVGLHVADIVFDSWAFQFWGSEQYLRDIPLMDNRSYRVNPQESLFTGEQIESFKAKAKELNINNDGDSASFYLYKS